jgi:hypothetical protein
MGYAKKSRRLAGFLVKGFTSHLAQVPWAYYCFSTRPEPKAGLPVATQTPMNTG